MADKDLAVYGAIFMPTSVINLVAGFVIRPYLTKLSLNWEMGRVKLFIKIIGRLSGIIAVLTVLAVGGAWVLGIPVLSLLYEPVLLFTCDYEKSAFYFRGLWNCGCSGCGDFCALRPLGRNLRRRSGLCCFDGGPDGALWDSYACGNFWPQAD